MMPSVEFGFVTMATSEASLRRARAMAVSLRHHEPSARVCLLAVGQPVGAFAEFDSVIDVQAPEPFSRPFGFFNKLLAILLHAPFGRNLFLDDDTLVLGPLTPIVEAGFAGLPIGLNCDHRSPNDHFEGPNHLDPTAVAARFGVSLVMDPYGGGHFYFERPQGDPLIEEAIQLPLFEPALYRSLSGDGFLSDEVALAIVAHRHGVRLPSIEGWIDPLDRQMADRIRLSVDSWSYSFPGRDRGDDRHVRLLHFCADGKSSRVYELAIGTLLGDAGDKARKSWRRPHSR